MTESKTPKSRRVVPLSPTAEKVLCDVRTRQRAERLMAGSMWQPTPYHDRAGRALRSSQRATGAEDGSQARRAAFYDRAAHIAALCCLGDVGPGVPLKVVSEIFGHASLAMTGDIYGHVSPDVSRDALTRLSDAPLVTKVVRKMTVGGATA